MREFTVIFRSVTEIKEFARLANRQPFAIQILSGNAVLDAHSILNLCCLGLHTPLTVRVDAQCADPVFCTAIHPFLVESPVSVH